MTLSLPSIHEQLADAAKDGNAALCAALISQGADPETRFSGALCAAAAHGHQECVRLLIPISKPKINSSAALYFSAASGHSECVKLLIPASDPKAEYSRALLISAQRGHLECVLPLLPVSDHLMSRFTLPPLMLRNNVPLYSALDCGRASVFSAMLAHEPRLLGSLNFPALLAESISLGHADLSALLASIIEQKELSSTLPVRASAKSSMPGRL